MTDASTSDHEIRIYFNELDSYLKNELELLGFIVAELMRNSTPVTDRSIISSITYKLETETKEETLLSYRKILAFLIGNNVSR
ncbi:biofilm development regulator YmgB/AriR family protein (plasmid) [Serratia sp. L9]|uniref:biofilm development regulator YmgB/AriR family protein n=1 Tax=Serratia sp. L9 TaxID=3423946 RepID=UPI003D664AD7